MADSRFDAAVARAIGQGRFRDPSTASREASSPDGDQFVLRTASGVRICMIPLAELEGSSSEGAITAATPTGAPIVFRGDEEAAIAWATSMGYPVPRKLNGCLMAAGVALGLMAAVVPGVLLLVILLIKDRDYKRDMRSLVAKWVDAGRPQPGVAAVQVKELEKVVERKAAPTSMSETEGRLSELQAMKEKGLISDEEYNALRKKALGL